MVKCCGEDEPTRPSYDVSWGMSGPNMAVMVLVPRCGTREDALLLGQP